MKTVWQKCNQAQTITIRQIIIPLRVITTDRNLPVSQTIRSHHRNHHLNPVTVVGIVDKLHSMGVYKAIPHHPNNSKMLVIMCSVSNTFSHSFGILIMYIGKTIGKGTFGKVKLGNHNLTGEKVRKRLQKVQQLLI